MILFVALALISSFDLACVTDKGSFRLSINLITGDYCRREAGVLSCVKDGKLDRVTPATIVIREDHASEHLRFEGIDRNNGNYSLMWFTDDTRAELNSGKCEKSAFTPFPATKF